MDYATGPRLSTAFAFDASAFNKGLPLSEEQQTLILGEEERAWEFARLELDFLGFSEWVRFDATKTCGLDAYRQMFWPTAR
jgi:hypothetical protein